MRAVRWSALVISHGKHCKGGRMTPKKMQKKIAGKLWKNCGNFAVLWIRVRVRVRVRFRVRVRIRVRT